jgi:hypothetical protein
VRHYLGLLELLEGRACFIEYDEEINDVIYSGPFSDICDELESEQVHTFPSALAKNLRN